MAHPSTGSDFDCDSRNRLGLERLLPTERAAFVLRTVFAYEYSPDETCPESARFSIEPFGCCDSGLKSSVDGTGARNTRSIS